MKLIPVEIFIFLRLFMFDYRALFICVTDRTFPKIAKPAYCFNIFRPTFGLLFCLLDRKLILGSKPICQTMRKSPCAVWSVVTFPQMDKKEGTFFSWKLHTSMCSKNFFQISTLSITWWKFSHKCFWEERYRLFLYSNKWWYKHFLTLNYLLQYAKRLSSTIAR